MNDEYSYRERSIVGITVWRIDAVNPRRWRNLWYSESFDNQSRMTRMRGREPRTRTDDHFLRAESEYFLVFSSRKCSSLLLFAIAEDDR